LNNIAKLAVAISGWALVSSAFGQHPWNAGFTNSSVVAIAGTERKSSAAYGSLGDTGGHTYTVQTRATPGGWISGRPNDPEPHVTGQGTPNPWYHTGNFYFYKGEDGIYTNPVWGQSPADTNHLSDLGLPGSGNPIVDDRNIEFEHFYSPDDTLQVNDNLAAYVAGDVLPRKVEERRIHIPSPYRGLENWVPDLVSISSGSTAIPSISKEITAVTDYFPQIRSAASTALPASELFTLVVSKRSFHVFVRSYDVGHWDYPTMGDPYWVETGRIYLFEYKQDYFHEKFPYQIRKDLAGAQSVDSRRTYGQPDVAGQFPAVDPNAPARNITFKDWIYRGGLFVGQMNPDSNDLSGAARIQIYPGEGPNSNTEIATLSLLHLGSAPGTWPEFATLTSIVAASDANLNVPLNQLTWANKWTLTSGSVELLLDGATPNDDYVNWPASILPSAPRMILQHKNENLDTPPANSGWHYFASPARLTGETSYPLIDGHPRVWYVDRQTPVRWVQP
jgi:hypothetical protein